MLLPFIALLLAGQAPSTPCPAVAPPPAGLAGWVTNGSRPNIGTRFTLTGAANVAGLTAEERARGGTAAIIEIAVATAGTYSIALSDGAWIDVVQRGKPLAATGHEHGAPCTGIRKIVKFTLGGGPVQLRLSGIKAATIGILIARN